MGHCRISAVYTVAEEGIKLLIPLGLSEDVRRRPRIAWGIGDRDPGRKDLVKIEE